MNYEIAIELKAAGFPNIKDLQHRQGREFIPSDGSVPVYSLGDAADVEDWFVPTLEELIEACGQRFQDLCLLGEAGQFQWYCSITKESDGEHMRHYGTTPTEAVSRLWLALNKKGKPRSDA
jgi:hypothetical protein